MAVKGQVAKQEIVQKILEAFGDKAFLYNDGKEIRINWTEAGELVQIKVALTAAKVAVENGSDNAIPTIATTVQNTESNINGFDPAPAQIIEPTVEEKTNIANLLARLGL